ncbi:MAG: hypothetical protein R3E01_18015 [Pirellulaceae bacterium]|nr:phosphatase PAP2 family protein [Planctomycetales bacterium]
MNQENTFRCRTRGCWTLTVRYIATGLAIVLGIHLAAMPGLSQQTVARQWDEALLSAIRIDIPAPTVHSRNLYHTSAAMYDAWAAFDSQAQGAFYPTKHSAADIAMARDEAISYAAYRVLSDRYALAFDPAASQSIFDDVMIRLGYDKSITTTTGDSPAAIGNRIAAQILAATNNDGSNEANGYVDPTGYQPVNDPMTVDYPAVSDQFSLPLADANRWQPLYIDSFTLQNGIVLGSDLQHFIGPHWGNVTPFAMNRNGSASPFSWSNMDPGPPPQLGGVGSAKYQANAVALIHYSHSLDPNQGPGAAVINISPSVNGNRPLGTHDNHGYAVNPVTGQAYADNFVKTADYGRVLAEYWADGPDSETPPGHWNVIANQVADNPQFVRQFGGTGPVVDPLEWDVKTYLALNGAVHDAAIAAWGLKREYDYVRPITMIRYLGSLGQSSDPGLPSFHPLGLPLEDGVIELITAESIAEGGRHHNAFLNANKDHNGDFFQFISREDMVGKIAIHVWNHEPEDPDTEVSGTDWTLAENWVPYQSDNFVTPAFAAYVSGHSTFSRAAAEVLAHLTGSEYFPGGIGEQSFTSGFLDFEAGPSNPITLQWATYYDAADEAGISRLWGGIHIPEDDFAGRIIGSEIGIDAFLYAMELFGTPFVLQGDYNGNGTVDAADYTIWKDSFGSSSSLAADGNGNGIIDAADYTIWKDNFGESLSTFFAHQVPEPATGVWIVLMALLMSRKLRPA